MNNIKNIAKSLKSSFNWVESSGKSGDLAMPYGEGYIGLAGYFREGQYHDLKKLVEYVKENIPETEWRKGMNLIAQERKQNFNVRPNPLSVAIQEAEAVIRGYEKRQEMLKDKTDYSKFPERIRPVIPSGLDTYAFEKIEGLIGLVIALNEPTPIMIQKQIQTMKFKGK